MSTICAAESNAWCLLTWAPATEEHNGVQHHPLLHHLDHRPLLVTHVARGVHKLLVQSSGPDKQDLQSQGEEERKRNSVLDVSNTY